jgi:hypothetical protein
MSGGKKGTVNQKNAIQKYEQLFSDKTFFSIAQNS